MKRRKFLKAGSAIIASTSLAACGGGDTTAPSLPANNKTDVKPDPIKLPDPVKPIGDTSIVKKTFYITEGTKPLANASGTFPVYFRGFSSAETVLNVPGEALMLREGNNVEITIINKLTTAHNFTIENVNRVGNEDLTVSVDLAPGATETVSFIAGSPGTYMYYDSSNAPYNRLLGLHGALAVIPANSDNELYPSSRTFKKQLFWVFNTIDPVWHNALGAKPSLTPNTKFKPRYFTMNGLSGRPPGAPGDKDGNQSSMYDPRTKLKGAIGDRTLVRCVNAGKMKHSVHIHANHMEWLPKTGESRKDVWEKDIIPLMANGGIENVIYPFAPPPDCVNTFDEASIIAEEANGVEIVYPMHLHDEMTQTAAGGSYQFGAMTDVFYTSK
ncbi:MAG: multicopper oxidase domain-containing protein [Thiohalomonadales bacterium]